LKCKTYCSINEYVEYIEWVYPLLVSGVTTAGIKSKELLNYSRNPASLLKSAYYLLNAKSNPFKVLNNAIANSGIKKRFKKKEKD
jgi:hypothetical protein